MESIAVIKRIEETKAVGYNGFEIRDIVVVTEEQHAQTLQIQFVQGKCPELDNFAPNDKVKITYNIEGREVIKDNKPIVFVKLKGWKIEKLNNV